MSQEFGDQFVKILKCTLLYEVPVLSLAHDEAVGDAGQLQPHVPL